MSLHIECWTCKKPIEFQGALVFSPPSMDGWVMKYHVCHICWGSIIAMMEVKREGVKDG